MKLESFITTIFKTSALVLALAVILPSVVKLSHTFTHHSHKVCEVDNALNTHFHKVDFDCDFYKFKITKQYYFQNKLVFPVNLQENFKISNSQYEFVSDFQKLQIALRGPPQLI